MDGAANHDRNRLRGIALWRALRCFRQPGRGARRFGRPITVTGQPFDPAKVNYELGDYQALATTPGAFHPMWNDTRTGELELFTAAVSVRGLRP
jgi:hypothetical protein